MNEIVAKPPLRKNTILADKFLDFTSNAVDFPMINTDQPAIPDLFKDYQYPVSAWPVIIAHDKINVVRQLCTRLPKLLRQIPALYFKNNHKDIANFYFKGNEMLAQLALLCHKKNIEIGCRLDLTLTEDGFKVLEVNVGSSIGGWQIQSFESVIRKLHKVLSDPMTADKYHIINTQKEYIRFLVEKIRQYVHNIGNEINVFISFPIVGGFEVGRKGVQFFNDLLTEELASKGLKGRVLTGNITSLSQANGYLYQGDQRVHSVLLLGLNGENVPSDVFRTFITDKIYFPDHLGVPLISDKRNLSLLRALATEGKFSAEDNAFILRHIPWTAVVADKEVFFKEHPRSLLPMLKNEREHFVIKTANGFQGKNVFIGKYLDVEQWESALKEATETGGFIAQEFSESLNFEAVNRQNEWTSHKLIWGAFGFGEAYGGIWVRMAEAAKGVGVINSATGAVEAIVYELLN